MIWDKDFAKRVIIVVTGYFAAIICLQLTAICWRTYWMWQCRRCWVTIKNDGNYTLACKGNTLTALGVGFIVIYLIFLCGPKIFAFFKRYFACHNDTQWLYNCFWRMLIRMSHHGFVLGFFRNLPVNFNRAPVICFFRSKKALVRVEPLGGVRYVKLRSHENARSWLVNSFVRNFKCGWYMIVR